MVEIGFGHVELQLMIDINYDKMSITFALRCSEVLF